MPAPAPGSRVLAEWLDNQDRTTGPAVIASSNAIYMTHVLLPDDLPRKRRMLLAMVGHLVPEVWQQAATASVQTSARSALSNPSTMPFKSPARQG